MVVDRYFHPGACLDQLGASNQPRFEILEFFLDLEFFSHDFLSFFLSTTVFSRKYRSTTIRELAWTNWQQVTNRALPRQAIWGSWVFLKILSFFYWFLSFFSQHNRIFVKISIYNHLRACLDLRLASNRQRSQHTSQTYDLEVWVFLLIFWIYHSWVFFTSERSAIFKNHFLRDGWFELVL